MILIDLYTKLIVMDFKDEDIILLVKAGDGDKFVFLYDKYVKKIYDFIFYKLGDKDLAQDITSETFLKGYKNLSGFDIEKGTKFSSWIYTIANNLVIDHYRTNRIVSDYDWLNDMEDSTDILSQQDARHRLNEVISFLGTLDEDKKQIFMMRIWDKLSYEEISQITGKSVSNAKTIFSRVLKDIHARFGPSMMTFLLFIM